MLIAIVMGAIYGGVASPTEAAAVSALYSFLVAVLIYRDMGPLKEVPWRRTGEPLGGAARRNVALMVLALGQSAADPDVRQTVLAGAKTSIMLLFVIANAMLFAHLLTTERIPHALAEAIIS